MFYVQKICVAKVLALVFSKRLPVVCLHIGVKVGRGFMPIQLLLGVCRLVQQD